MAGGYLMKVGTNWKRFIAAHRLAWHPKCSRMHGHGFQVRVLVEGTVDPATGIVVDFGVLGADIDALIAPLDHRFLAAQDARLVSGTYGIEKDEKGLKTFLQPFSAGESYWIDGKYVLPKEDVVVLPLYHVSTENLAQYFLDELVKKEWAIGRTVTVQVTETGENVAEASTSVSLAKQ
jgi:6-pyruvoyl-tetrahydropterin synthase